MGISVYLLGNKPGAAVALEYLLQRKFDVKAVIDSQNEADNSESSLLCQIADRNNISIVEQKSLFSKDPVDLVISYMYRSLVKPELLKKAKIAAVNFHAAPLPKFGGWAFYNVAILEESECYGCTCHHMDEGFDSGDLCIVKKFPINAEKETAFSLERKAQKAMIKTFVEFCNLIMSGQEIPREKQNPDEVRYMNHKQFEELKKIPDDAGYDAIQKYARAFWYPPYGLAHILHNGHKVDVIPEIVKNNLADLMHYDDFRELSDEINQEK